MMDLFSRRSSDVRRAQMGLPVTALCAALTTISCTPSISTSRRGSSESIEREVLAHYARAAYYSDVGVVTSAIHQEDGSLLSETLTTFRTAYDRASGGISFEYTEAEPSRDDVRGVLWRKQRGALSSWRTVQPDTERLGIDEATASFAAVSHGASEDNLPLLASRRGHVDVSQAELIAEGEEVIRGERCIRLSGADRGQIIRVWISLRDYSIRRRTTWEVLNADRLRTLLAASSIPPNPAGAVLDGLGNEVIEETAEFVPNFAPLKNASAFEFTPPSPR